MASTLKRRPLLSRKNHHNKARIEKIRSDIEVRESSTVCMLSIKYIKASIPEKGMMSLVNGKPKLR